MNGADISLYVGHKVNIINEISKKEGRKPSMDATPNIQTQQYHDNIL